jgi:AcrR family transcriptional regulator
LLESAAVVFAERGYADAKLADVAAGAGVTKALVYRHFESKAGLYVELLEQHSAEVADAVGAAATTGAQAEEYLRRGLDAFLGVLERRPFARRLLFSEPGADERVAAAYDRVHARARAALVHALAEDGTLLRGEADRERALGLLAQMFESAVNGVAAWWVGHPDVPRGEVVERVMGLISPGLGELRARS